MKMNRNTFCFFFIVTLLITGCVTLYANEDAVVDLPVFIGQSKILDFSLPVKRISIANPEIADATVTSPSQLVVNGKTLGVTSLIVWSENEDYTQYKIMVKNEASPKQISLKVRFIEINKTAMKEIGTDFLVKNLGGETALDVGSFGGKVNAPSDPLVLGNTVDLFLAIPSKDLSVIFKALQEKNLLTVLASPNLTAINGAEASFLAGGEFPIPIVSGAAGMQTVTIQFKEFGIRLNFIPTVMNRDLVNIKVGAEVSNLDFDNGITLSGFRVPSLTTRKTQTVVELKQGQYLVLGGLLSSEMSETVSRIPVLGHIPVLGYLFSSRRYQNKETELLISISPRIIEATYVDPVSTRQSELDETNKNSDDD